jgi:muramoyltetrapeptide carboxypeptidase
MSIIKPKAVQRGNVIGVVAPAGPVNRERMDCALARVEERGFRIKIYGDIDRSHGYLAGDDETRTAELAAAFGDPEARAVWCARGGYGVVRLLDRIDFGAIRQNPKVFIGFSDITALHVAIGQQTGLVTFHAPNLQDGFGKPDDMPAASERSLWRAVMGETRSGDAGGGYDYEIAGLEGVRLHAIHGGKAAAPVVGGNLAVLAGLCGTPFEIQTTGKILFIEDVSERLYRIDRYLSQLRLAGKLHDAVGVLVGSFSYDEGDTAEDQNEVRRLLTDFLAPLGVPVLAGFPAGHERINLTLPMNVPIEIDADAGRVRVLEAACF